MIKQEVKSDKIISISAVRTTPMKVDDSEESRASTQAAFSALYSDGAMAMLRENSTNAMDSHITAGQTRPIEVTLPTHANPMLMIQDWGCGMGFYEINHIYGVFGKSTKRREANTNGNYGFGSKAALAYVDSFQLECVKDGKGAVILVYRDEAGMGQLATLAEYDTELPNGVTVKIPIEEDDVDSYAYKAADLFRMWEKGTVLVNGEEPSTIADEGFTDVGDLGWFNHSSGSKKSLSVEMGGLTYSVSGLDENKMNRLFENARPLASMEIILHAGLGEIAFPPAREAITINKINMRFLKARIEAMYEYLRANAQKSVDEAKDPWDAMNVMSTLSFLKEPFSYNGQKHEQHIRINELPNTHEVRTYRWNTSYGSKKEKREIEYDAWFGVDLVYKATLIVAKDSLDFERACRNLNAYRNLQENNHKVYHVGYHDSWDDNIFIQSMIENGNIIKVDAETTIEEVKAFRKANRVAKVATGRVPAVGVNATLFSVYEHEGDGFERVDMPLAEIYNNFESVYLFHGSPRDYSPVRTLEAFDTYGEEGEILIFVPSTRSLSTMEERLNKNEVKNSMINRALRPRMIEKAKEFVAENMVNNTLEILSRHGVGFDRLLSFSSECSDQFKSPFVRELATAYAERRKKFSEISSHFDMLSSHGINKFDCGVEDSMLDSKELSDEWDTHYAMPLAALNNLGYGGGVRAATIKAQVVNYLNATFDALGDPSFYTPEVMGDTVLIAA